MSVKVGVVKESVIPSSQTVQPIEVEKIEGHSTSHLLPRFKLYLYIALDV